ncbi:MAG TPA: 3-dehydroquinate synthase [Puia sp.]|jgi:3-dehydroquinate synthase|nr:3-dehydroquinate synthase [Puia sp.]
MQKKIYQFPSRTVTYYFDAEFSQLEKLVDKKHAVIITDENVFRLHKQKFAGWKSIVIKAGEEFKVQATVDSIVDQLIQSNADRKTFLIGVGGGVVTDITGYVASVYMRGIRFGFVPSSLLAMVDAAIGGKNGIDVGIYKNIIGAINQPEFLLFDISLLKTLPNEEWINAFAEIIKHAAIKDATLFAELEKNKLSAYQKNRATLSKLIIRNVQIKSAIVKKDEFEKGERKLLNFGHTIGHAIENMQKLPHGFAISIGMAAACMLSEQLADFKGSARVIHVLKKYGLPTKTDFKAAKVFEVLKMDKKKEQSTMNYVLLKKIGQGIVKPIPVDDLGELIQSITMAR